MAQFVLEILDGDRAGEVVTLGERPLRIGRKPQNDLVLVDEKASGVHAEIAFEGDRHVLRDLGSTNGTLMDGRKITEVVLGSGDTFTIGRVRLRFRGEGEASAVADAGDGFAVERIDAARLQAAKVSSRPVTLLLVVLVVVLGAGGYVFWRGRGGASEADGQVAHGPRAEVREAGNKLAQEIANCEADAGWDLAVAGVGFHATGRANTGHGAFEATRGAATGAEAAAAPADFAVAATAERSVLPGRTVVAIAHLNADAGGRIGVRLLFWSSIEGNPFRFRSGAPVVAHAGWERVEARAAVPAGADRCRVEIVALLPQADSMASFDDVALLEEGQEAAVEQKIGEVGTVLGTGQSLAVRSMDTDQPATVLAILPAEFEPAFAGLAAAGQLAASDVGATIAATVDDRAATFTLQGSGAAELAFPAETAASLLGRGDDGFAGVDANNFTASQVLLGDRLTRCMVTLPAAATFTGRVQSGVYWLRVPAATFQLVVGFRAERQQARELLRNAEAAAQQGRPGAAQDGVAELLRTVPHDSETLAQALQRRGEWQEALATRLRSLAKDLEDAEFFDTRGSFERIVGQLDDLLQLYGANNVEDPQAIAAMRQRAADRLRQLDAQRAADQRQRLENMAAVFEATHQANLAKLVRDYVQRELAN